MGLLDGLFGMFSSMGATVTQNVTQQQPTTPSGASYTAGGTTVTSQPAQPVTIQPQSPFSDPVGWLGGAAGYVGGGIQYAGQQIQNIAAPVAPIAPIAMAAPFIAAPLIVGSMAVSGVQGMLAPKPQPVTAPVFGGGAAYTPMIISTPTSPTSPTTFFVSAGAKGQIPVVGKMTYGVGGDYLIYDVPRGHSITNIASGGGPGSLQAGVVSTKPLTPVIYTREGAMTTIDPRYGNVKLAAAVLANPYAYSDVGAEAYGGVVMPLDTRTLESSGAVMGKYPVSSGNLGNLVDPYILNQPKQNWAMDLPWSMENYTSAPVIQSVDMQGRMTAISPLGMQNIGMIVTPKIQMSSMSNTIYPTTQIAPTTQRNWLEQANYDVGGFLGIRASGMEQTPGRLPARDMVANLPKPFISRVESVVTTPASPIIDIFGFKFNAGPVGEFFNPPVTTVTTRGSPVQVDTTKMGGAGFTNMFIVGGKPSDTRTYPVGAPVVVGDVSTQMYETVKLSNIGMVTPITTMGVAGTSKFGGLKQNVRDILHLPTPEVGEKAMRYASLANPFTAPYVISSLLTEKFNPEQASNARMVESLVGMRGQYTQFYEDPILVPISYGAGAVFGGLWRGAEGVSAAAMPTLVKNVPTIAKTLQLGGKALPYVFGAVIVGETAYRSTEGFSNFTPETVVTKSKGIAMQEIAPGFAGFGMGYNAPENVGFIYRSAVKTPGKVSDAIWSTRQRIGGISRIEPGTLSSDFAVTGKPIPIVEQAPSTAMRYGIRAGEPVKTVGDYFDMQPGNRGILVSPKPPTAQPMKYGFKAGEPVRTVGEYFDIRSIGEQSLTTKSSIDSIDLIYARKGKPLDILPKSDTNVKIYSNRPFTAIQDISIEEMGVNPWKHTTNLYDPWKVKPVTEITPKVQAIKETIKEVKITPERRSLIEESRWYAVRGLTKPLEYEMPSNKIVGSDIEQGQYGSVVVLKAPIQMEIPSSKLATASVSEISQKQVSTPITALSKLGIRASVGTHQELTQSRLKSSMPSPIIMTAQAQKPLGASFLWSFQEASQQAQVSVQDQIQRQVAMPSLITMTAQAQRQGVSQAAQQATKSMLAQVSIQDIIQSTRQAQAQRQITTQVEKQQQSQLQKQITTQIQVPEQVPVLITTTVPITTEIIKTTEKVTPRVPEIPVIPFGWPSGGLRDYPQRRERGAYGFKEVSPTWTPGQMGRALFTGKFTRTVTSRDNLPKRQYKSNVPRLPKMPKVSKRGRKNILKGR